MDTAYTVLFTGEGVNDLFPPVSLSLLSGHSAVTAGLVHTSALLQRVFFTQHLIIRALFFFLPRLKSNELSASNLPTSHNTTLCCLFLTVISATLLCNSTATLTLPQLLLLW
jgi:hypothetical protein